MRFSQDKADDADYKPFEFSRFDNRQSTHNIKTTGRPRAISGI